MSWIGNMTSGPSLDTGLFICTQYKFVIFKLRVVPNLLVEVKDLTRFDGELRIPRENPGTMLPGPDGIFIEPSPYGATADCCYKTGLTCVSGNIRRAPAGQGNLMNGRKFTGNRFNLNDEIWGGRTGGDPVEDAPPILRGAAQRNVFATC